MQAPISRARRVLALASASILLGLTGTISAQAATGPAYCGALNMLHDPTMATVPMTHDAAQGNAGMFNAVAVSCP